MKHTQPTTKWYNQHGWALLESGAVFLLAYIVGARSLDTGSRWEYLATLGCLALGINRLAVTVRQVRRRKSGI